MAGTLNLVVCADDYALTPGVSLAIRELVAAGAISATSVMTVSPHWARECVPLRELGERADIGLHLTLTDHVPLGAMPQLAPHGRLPTIGRLIQLSLLGQLDAAEIETEIRRQLAAFLTQWGRPPDHIDGHHHVHQLPGVRGALFKVLSEFEPPSRPYVRNCAEPLRRVLARRVGVAKAALISKLGMGFARAARQSGIRVNDGFSGVYDFASPKASIATIFERMVRWHGPAPLMMCHPGYPDAELERLDPLVAPREAERAFLMGPSWRRIVGEAGLSVGRFGSAKTPDHNCANAK